MDWARVVRHAAVLFAAQLLIGLAEGVLTPGGATAPMVQFLAGKSAGFLVGSAIFAHLAYVQAAKPWVHAVLVLPIHLSAGVMLTLLVMAFPGGGVFLIFVALDYVILACALIAGTVFGTRLRLDRTRPVNDRVEEVE